MCSFLWSYHVLVSYLLQFRDKISYFRSPLQGVFELCPRVGFHPFFPLQYFLFCHRGFFRFLSHLRFRGMDGTSPVIQMSFLRNIGHTNFFRTVRAVRPTNAITRVFFVVPISHSTRPSLRATPKLFPTRHRCFLGVLSHRTNGGHHFIHVYVTGASFRCIPRFLFVRFVLLTSKASFIFSYRLHYFRETSLVVVSFAAM